MEIWAKIKGFENYMVSNKGHVKSLNYNNTGKEQILKPKINKHNGILEVTLSKNNKRYYRTVCRLVLETFLNIKFTRGKRQEITYDLDHRYRPKYEYYGQILPTKEISKKIGIDSKTIRNRITKLYWNIYECEIPKAIHRKGGEKL